MANYLFCWGVNSRSPVWTCSPIRTQRLWYRVCYSVLGIQFSPQHKMLNQVFKHTRVWQLLFNALKFNHTIYWHWSSVFVRCAFRSVRRSTAPFGGIQLIVCGDFLQLPPVSKGKEKASFCFQVCLGSENIPVCSCLCVLASSCLGMGTTWSFTLSPQCKRWWAWSRGLWLMYLFFLSTVK